MNPSQRIEEHTMCLKVMHLEIGLFSMAFFYRILVKIDEISLIDQIKTFVPNFFVESDQLIKTGLRNLEKDHSLYKSRYTDYFSLTSKYNSLVSIVYSLLML